MERLGRVRAAATMLACTYIPLKQRYDAQQTRFDGAGASGPRRPRPGPAEEGPLTSAFARQRREGQGAFIIPPGVAQGLLLADGLLISANSGTLVVRSSWRGTTSTSSTTRRSASPRYIGGRDRLGCRRELMRLGADSPSFFVCVNKAMVPKVGGIRGGAGMRERFVLRRARLLSLLPKVPLICYGAQYGPLGSRGRQLSCGSRSLGVRH